MSRKRLLPILGLLSAVGVAAAAGCGTGGSDAGVRNGSAPTQQNSPSPQESPGAQVAPVEQDSGAADEAGGGPLTRKEIEIYLLGRRIGECLFSDCLIFSGVVRSAGEIETQSGEPEETAVKRQRLQIAPEQLLWGDEGRVGRELTLTRFLRPAYTKSDPGPWTPWEGVQTEVGGHLLLVLEADPARQTDGSGEPKVEAAVSDERLSAEIRNLVARHAEFQKAPDNLLKAVAPLSQQPDDLFVSYLVGYLKWTRAGDVAAADRAALVRASLIKTKDIPRAARGQIVQQLWGDFNHMSPAGKREVTDLLLSAALDDDERVSASAFDVLVRAADEKHLDLGPLLDAKRRRALATSYRAARASGAVREAHPAFEAQLGIDKAPLR